jgi:hypothetical protein
MLWQQRFHHTLLLRAAMAAIQTMVQAVHLKAVAGAIAHLLKATSVHGQGQAVTKLKHTHTHNCLILFSLIESVKYYTSKS